MIRHHHGAILVTVILNLVVAFFWYSPYLFLNPWAAGLGKQVTDLRHSNPLPIIGVTVGTVLSCYVLSWLFQLVGADTIRDGASAGIVLWLGIALPVLLSHYMLAGISFSVLYIDALNALFTLVMTGSILAVWRRR
jgi:hypothetical protein